MRSLFTSLTSAGLLCAAMLLSATTLADGNDPQRTATAQTIYEQATADMDRKDYVAACKKLEEVIKLVPEALGAKMTLGECYEALGRSASAWAQYTIVDGLAPKQGQTERAQKAAAKVAALKPKLATLTLEVPADVGKTPGLAITRDGAPVGEVQWGTPLPVDKGAHEIAASAPGRKPWKKSLYIMADGAALTVKLEPLAPAAIAPDASAAAPPPSSSELEKPAPRSRTPAIALGAVGLAGLIGGGVLLGFSGGKSGEAEQVRAQIRAEKGYCAGTFQHLRCDNLRSTYSASDALGNVSLAAFGLGVVAVGAAAAYLLWPEPKPDAKINARVTPAAGPGAAGLLISGSF